MRYQIRHALVQFGADTILENVDFEVHDREKIAIVGRNGCGKTTLLKLIAGDIQMNNPDSDEECGITSRSSSSACKTSSMVKQPFCTAAVATS